MKELLNEFLQNILSEARFKAVKIDGDSERIVYFGSQQNVQAAIAANTHRAYNPAKDKDLPADRGQDSKPKPAQAKTAQVKKAPAEKDIGKKQAKPTGSEEKPKDEKPQSIEDIAAESKDEEEANARGVYDETDELQRSIRASAGDPKEFYSALDKLGDDEERRMLDDGKAGPGGVVASTGETLCTKSQSDFIRGRYSTAAARSSPRYTEQLERLKLQQEQKPKSLQTEIGEIADMYGLYNEDGTVDTEECLAIMAEERTWSEEQDEKLRNTTAGKKFGGGKKGEENRRSWLRAAFHASYSLQNNGPENWDRSTGRVLKANSRTDGVVEKVLQDKLKEAIDSGDVEAQTHYRRQLDAWKKFQPYHDTYMVYQDTSGRTCVYHISNKKGSQLQDPHNNTSPIHRLKNFALAATRLESLEGGKEEARQIVAKLGSAETRARDGVKNTDAVVWSTLSQLKPEPDDLKLLGVLSAKLPLSQTESEVGDKYFADVVSPTTQSGRALVSAGVDTTDRVAVVTHILKAVSEAKDVSKLPTAWLKLALKYGTLAQRVYEKESRGLDSKEIAEKLGLQEDEVKGILESPSMKKLAKMKEVHAAGLTGVNTQFVQELHDIDGTQPGYTEDNGPAMETYVRGTLQALHIDTYIKNYDDDIQVESGGFGTKPVDVRNCMAKLSGFKGDTTTPGGRQELMSHLARRVRVEPGSDAVYLLSESERDKNGNPVKIYIAKETWRQAGAKDKKVATSFGDHLRVCLRKETGRRLSSRMSGSE